MAERIFVAVAWPYANYLLHAGQAAGAYLPADIFARYHRMRGNDVLMVSGSDCHGTPITVAADNEGITPREIIDRYHPKILEAWERFGISFDLYTTTLTDNHYETTQELFTRLLEQDLLYTGTQDQLYDPEAQRFLPDRYVEGICPLCSYPEARGDQCDQCGAQLDAIDLIEPRSKVSGATPEVRESEHFMLRLSAFNEQLREWVSAQPHWRRNVANFTLGILEEGLKDRAITRDINWGVPLPVEGYDDKRIYVWFDAVIGYLSAAKEWAAQSGDPGGLAPLLGRRGHEGLLLHRQGQHRLPHAHLAGDVAGLRRPEPSPRRAREPVRQLLRGAEAEQVEGHGDVAARPAGHVRRRRRALLPDADHAGDERLRVPRGGADPREQRGPDRDVGEPREPRAGDDPAQLRRRRAGPGDAGSRRARRCWRRFARGSSGRAPSTPPASSGGRCGRR